MKVFKSHTRTSVTEYIERMTSQQYKEDNLDDIFIFPKEASQALRNVFKYGSKHSQLRALTILQPLMENCEKIHPYVASHKFIDKLKNLALSSSTDDEVHKRLMILFAQWSNNYKKKTRNGKHNNTMKNLNNKKKQHERQSSSKPNKPEKYTPSQVNQEIGSAIQNATNLVNAITLLNPDMDFENDDELQECVAKCKASSEQLFKIIPTISGGTQLGPLLQCNDQIQGALELYSKYCEDCKKSDLDDVTSNFEKTKLQNNTREKKSFDYTKDPFADPISPSRTPDPDAEKKIKTHPKW
ncbi:13785_t:CDS:2 [Entrophospora sp. SA101]|nr:13785_t:CDS:2 [Entrophospora sp. SA101]